MKKAFTLVELTVSIALLVMMIAFSVIVFKVSIEAYRVAGANAEIMLKMRTITGQLNRDFKGLRKDAPLLIWFQKDVNDPNTRFDQIMFFADGDFQSTRLYDFPNGFRYKIPMQTGLPIRGNVARIFYGQARLYDAITNNWLDPCDQQRDNDHDKILNIRQRTLARRQHILSYDPNLDLWPNPNFVKTTFDDVNAAWPQFKKNELYEHDSVSLAKWQTLTDANYFGEPLLGLNGGTIVNRCFNNRPYIDFNDPNSLHKLMCEGVGSFAIEILYLDTWVVDKKDFADTYRWFPDDDPNKDGTALSHFVLMASNNFGLYINVPHTVIQIKDPQPDYKQTWYAAEKTVYRYVPSNAPRYKTLALNYFPIAFKFTIRLYDSKGLIKEYRNGVEQKGRTFTHIIYLNN